MNKSENSRLIYAIAVLLLASFILSNQSFSQNNLVPNPSFEVYDTCPFYDAQIYHAIPWFQPCIPISSSDYYNSCNIDTISNVPNNYLGIQYAHSGNGYAGISTGYLQGNNYREYIEVELLDTLQKNYRYCVSFFVSCADYSKRACDGMGMYFSNGIILYSAPPLIVLSQYIPQVSNPNGVILSDTANWVAISDTLTANGGEKYITIGNFKRDSVTNWITIDSNALHLASYYFIDDVSVILCDSTTGIEVLSERDVTISPNPTTDIIRIGLAYAFQKDATIQIYSSQGSLMMESDFREELDVSKLAMGIYFLGLETKKGRVVKKVIISNE